MEFEAQWWGNCCNTYGEESKQMVYANRMGLKFENDHINVRGKKILDIGGGPVSLLLKTWDLGAGKVVDPSRYPEWTLERYKCKGIDVDVANAESITDIEQWDEVWIYNVLQHVQDPTRAQAGTPRGVAWTQGYSGIYRREGLYRDVLLRCFQMLKKTSTYNTCQTVSSVRLPFRASMFTI
jgi:hypothetical protein